MTKKTKNCSTCGEKPLEEFSKGRSECKKCRTAKTVAYDRAYRKRNREALSAYAKRYRKKNRDRVNAVERQARIRRKYGLTPEREAELLEKQGNECLICGRKFSDTVKPVRDHCHNTDYFRGFLCRQCNAVAFGAIPTLEIAYRLLAFMEGSSLLSNVNANGESDA